MIGHMRPKRYRLPMRPGGRGPRDVDGWGSKRYLRSWPWRVSIVRRVLIEAPQCLPAPHQIRPFIVRVKAPATAPND